MMKFSERTMQHYRAFMDQKNISQRELADAMKISEPAISMLFGKNGNPTLRTIDRIEAALIDILNRRPPDNFVFVDREHMK